MNPNRLFVTAAAMALLPISAFAQLSNSPRASAWTTNGTVHAVRVVGDKTYIGGDFTYVGPQVGGATTINLATGATKPGFPSITGDVRCCVPDGEGGWYIGGGFNMVGGVARQGLARILPNGQLDTSWSADLNGGGAINSIVRYGSHFVVGGIFSTIAGQPVPRLAAFRADTGTIESWTPSPNLPVNCLAVEGTTLYVGGSFSSIGFQSRAGLAAYSALSIDPDSWNPGSGTINDLAVANGVVYVAGSFGALGGQPRSGFGAVSAATGTATSWNPSPNGSVNAVAVSGSTVYIGGSFTQLAGENRSRIGAVDAVTGAATSWDPTSDASVDNLVLFGSTVYASGTFGTIGGQTRFRVAALNSTTGAATAFTANANGMVSCIGVDGSELLIGGSFTSAGGHHRSRVAALDSLTGILTPWNPSASGIVYAIEPDGSTIYVGGQFSSIGAESRSRIAAIDATTGMATAWNPGADNSVLALAKSGSSIYAGGSFTSIGGASLSNLAAIDAVSASALAWNPAPNGAVNCIVPSGGNFYVGGQFTTIAGQTRGYIAALDSAGAALSWAPNASGPVSSLTVTGTNVRVGGSFTTLGGSSRSNVGALTTGSNVATFWNPGASQPVYAVAESGASIYMGGAFTTAGGQTRGRLAAISIGGATESWAPTANGTVRSIAAANSSVYVGCSTFEQYSSTSVPAAPGWAGAAPTGPNSIAWTWQDNSSRETGYAIYTAANGSLPALQTTTAANTTSWVQTGLTPSTPVAMVVFGVNASGASTSAPGATAYTHAATPLTPTLGLATTSTMPITLTSGDRNPSTVEYSIYHLNTASWLQANGSLGASPVWQTAATWGTTTATGLATGTLHSFAARARNTVGIETVNGAAASAGTDVTLVYNAGANGSLTGTTTQTIAYGTDGTSVSAVPATGYSFTQWSDSGTANPRTDQDVVGNLSVTASFADLSAPTANVIAAAQQVGGAITGTYSANDNGTGVASVTLYVREPGSGWTSAGTITGGAWSYTPTLSGNAADGLFHFTAVATDNASNTGVVPTGSMTGQAVVLYNDSADSEFAATFNADGATTFPMTSSEFVVIQLTGVTAPVNITVERNTGNVAPIGFMPERLIDESLSINGALNGATATITWHYSPVSTNAPGFTSALNTVFQFSGTTQTGQYAVTPTANTLVIGPVTGFSDWFAGSHDATTDAWTTIGD
jgi:hypothetical protein